jgi:urease accessory protein
MRRAFAVHPRRTWPEAQALDQVTLAYLDRHRRRIRLVADSGETFLLDLERPRHLADGDGLELDGGGYIRVSAAPEPVLEIAGETPAGLLRIAWHLGNRHLPVQVAGDRLRIRADPVIADLVLTLGGRLTALAGPFDPEAGAYAATAPHHDHD